MSAQLPRRSLLWLMAAQVVVAAPHVPHLPYWLLGALALAFGWRYRVWQGRWSLPTRAMRVLLVFMSFVAVALQWRTLNGLEPAVALLAIAAGLKTLEMHDRRDFLIVCFVAYFLVAAQVLFEQEIQYALYALAGAIAVTAALVARHQPAPAPGFPAPLTLALRMLGQAVPLMLVLFVVFPRISPLWSLPQNKTAAKTGPAETLSPGDIARLSGSNELAFRVTFEGAIPPQRMLYWRGLVLSDFDGRTWSQGQISRLEGDLAQRSVRKVAVRPVSFEPSGREVRYEVILEPSNQPWAYTLGYPLEYDTALRLGSDYRLMTTVPVRQRERYTVRADLDAVLEPELGVLRRKAELALPQGYNPRTRALAAEWRALEPTDQGFIDRVLQWFNRESFTYTLTPALLGEHSIDDFLFGARRGFCEHYASSFVFLLRAGGIPARVVVGYQGGERNPYQDYLLVHQFDAHAWAEAWLEGRGWVRFDPTAAVAPERVESSLGEALGDEFLAGSPLAMERYRGVAVLAWIRMRWDLVTYQWAKMVLQYDRERQFALLNGLLGELSPARLVSALLGCGALVLGLVTLSLFGGARRVRRDAATAAFLRVCEQLARAGIVRLNGEGPQAYCARASAARPDLAAELQALTADYVACSYRPLEAAERQEALLRLLGAARRFRAGR